MFKAVLPSLAILGLVACTTTSQSDPSALTEAQLLAVAERTGCDVTQVTITELSGNASQSSWLATCGDKNRAFNCTNDAAGMVCAPARPPAA